MTSLPVPPNAMPVTAVVSNPNQDTILISGRLRLIHINLIPLQYRERREEEG